MREIVRMIVVLAVITGASGLLLAGVNQGTKEQRKQQLLQYVKGPAILEVLAGSSNDPLKNVKEIQLPPTGDQAEGGKVLDVFPAYKDGKLWAVAFEASGSGFGGDIGVVVGIDVQDDRLLGVGITTSKETPGLGARIREAGFRNGFRGIPLDEDVKVKADGGEVDAISGATISSRGVCAAVNHAFELFRKNRETIVAALEK